MSFDPPFPLPPGVPSWARDFYDWLALVQDQIDQHSATLGRNGSAITQLRGKVVSQQDELDQITAQLTAADGRIDALIASQAQLAADLRAQIADLEAQLASANVPLDLSGLHAIADQLDADAPAADPNA